MPPDPDTPDADGGGQPEKPKQRRRKGTLDDATERIILEAIGNYGLTDGKAAEAAGIDPSTLVAWKRKGREAKSGRHKQFVDRLEVAKSRFQKIHAKRIFEAATEGETVRRTSVKEHADGSKTTEIVETTKPDWRASAWLLERGTPDWKQKTEHSGEIDVGGAERNVVIELVHVHPDQADSSDSGDADQT